ncbi:MAG: ATP phosphoribosyltransferase regulatory subunit [Clostridia bacterium]|nr:ATP phosphoribosyltransferase regulatory subunit [Clostridia bacterium]
MADWKRYTPEGTQDVLPEKCAEKMKMEATISEVFEGFGYHVVETPVLQFYDAFNTVSGKIPQEMMFKFFDAQGRILVLRPDITTCLARMVASKLDDGIYPKRLYYCGKVFRYIDAGTAGEREFCQAGIELFGADGDSADAEVIACAIEALLAAGLESFQIELGQVAFYKGIVAQAGLNEEDTETLRGHIDKKDTLAISEFLKSRNVEPGLASLLETLPTLFGGAEILDVPDVSLLNEQAKAAILNLKNVYSLLCQYGYGEYVSIDLSLLQGINRYTGIIFKGITHGIGYSVCAGGRYDGLTGEFGASLSAVGMSIGTDRLLTVLSRQGKHEGHIGSDFIVSTKDDVLTYQILTALRDCGYIAEQAFCNESPEALHRYAEENHIQGIVTATEGDMLKIENLALNETTEMSLLELLHQCEDDCTCGEEECTCGCHHDE